MYFFSQRIKNIFRTGHKLEAVDLEEPFMIRVATVFNVIGRILLLLFDGHNKFQYVDYESEDIYPIGWCLRTGHPLSTPHGISIHFSILFLLSMFFYLYLFLFYYQCFFICIYFYFYYQCFFICIYFILIELDIFILFICSNLTIHNCIL